MIDAYLDELAHTAERLDGSLRFITYAQIQLQRRIGQGLSRMRSASLLRPLGYARLGDYAVEHLGMSKRQAEELAHLEEVIIKYPAIDAAWQRGALSRSHVRLLLRHCEIEDDTFWAERAASMTVAQLDRTLKFKDAKDGRELLDESRPLGMWFQCPASPDLQFKWDLVTELASRINGRDVKPWEVLDNCIAELMAGIPLHIMLTTESRQTFSQLLRKRRQLRSEQADALRQHFESITNTWSSLSWATPELMMPELPAGCDALELDTWLRHALTFMRGLDVMQMRLLALASNARIHRTLQFQSLEHYAQERLGLGASTLSTILTLHRRLGTLPALLHAYECGRIGRTQAELVARIATRVTTAAWIEHALSITTRKLEDDVRFAERRRGLNLDVFPADSQTCALENEGENRSENESGDRRNAHDDGPGDPGNSDDHEARDPRNSDDHEPSDPGIADSNDAQNEQPLDPDAENEQAVDHPRDNDNRDKEQPTPPGVPAPLQLSQLIGVIRFFVPDDVIEHVEHGLELCRKALNRPDAPLADCLEVLLDSFIAEWAPIALKEAKKHKIHERDKWHCQVPGCTSRTNFHDHHIQFRSQGGGDQPDNRVTLCAAHHLHGVHANHITVKGNAPDDLRWTIGLQRSTFIGDYSQN